MKRLTCEMFGSTDLIKQEGVFIGQLFPAFFPA